MSPFNREAWDSKFGSGLRSEYEFTIYVATFGTDLSYNNGQTYLLILTGVDEDGVDAQEMLSVGAGWESLDGGMTISHPKKASINKMSVFGRWCYYAGGAMEESNSNYLDDKDPLDASIWVNTKWRLTEKEVGNEFTDRTTGKLVPARTRLMPDEFLGLDEDAAAAVPPATPASPSIAPSAPVESPAAAALRERARRAIPEAPAAVESVSLTVPLNGTQTPTSAATQLLHIAKQSPDFDTFLNQALQLESVVADEELAESVIDGGPTGYYLSNH